VDNEKNEVNDKVLSEEKHKKKNLSLITSMISTHRDILPSDTFRKLNIKY
jgi:hypothetical protein